MCGIFGHVGNLKKDLVVICTDTMAHRGPDASGYLIQEDIALGHRRLAILDLSDNGKQPMSYANGRYWIVYNGEVYNFIELRIILEKRGHRFQSNSDTEIIIAAFLEWGEDCVNKFNGMWAFAIWDNLKKDLFLSRDRFGKKPLFYTFLPSGFAFASEMKALLPLLDEVRPNLGLVTDIKKIFTYESTEECVIEGIKRFPAGHNGWLKEKKLSLFRYWCTLDNLIQTPTRYEEQVEKFRELFVDACRLRMRSDVPIGTALSGGLDSSATISTIAHIAQNRSCTKNGRLSSDWQHAFVASFPNTPLDETKYAQMVTDYLGVQPTFIEIDPLDAIDRLSDFLYLFEELYITSPIPFMLTYEAMKKKEVKVTIDGHGADECWGGYSFDYTMALEDARYNFNQINMILDTFFSSYPSNSSQFQVESSKLNYWVKWKILNLGRKLIHKGLKYEAKDSLNYGFSNLDNLTKKLYLSTHDTILPTILRNYDRYSMANGVEIRMPFMDHRLVSFAFSLPWTSKIRNGFSKSIIRDAVAPYMPKQIAFRKSKIGFNSPILDWMKGPMREFFMDTINSKTFKHSTLINPQIVAQKICKVVNSPNASFQDAEKAWTMLSPYLWGQAVLGKKYKCKRI